MKTMDDWKGEMSKLYDDVRNGAVELKHADTLANVAGKYLKAEQLQLAREIFVADKARPLPNLKEVDYDAGLPAPKGNR